MSLSQKNNKLKKKKKTKMSKRIQKILLKQNLHFHTTRKKKINLFIYSSFISANTTGKIDGNKHWFCSIFFVPIVLLCDGPYVAGDISCSQKSRLQHHEWRLSNSMSAGEKEGWQVSVKTSADILKCKTVDKPPCEMVKEPLDSEVHSVSQCKYLPWTPVLYESFRLTPHTIEGCYN